MHNLPFLLYALTFIYMQHDDHTISGMMIKPYTGMKIVPF